MARPTDAKEPENKAKDAKAPAEGGGGNPTLVIIAMALVTLLGTSVAAAASVYFLAPMVIQPMIQQSLKTVTVKVVHENAEPAAALGHSSSVGPTFSMDEFTVNLKDPNPHYLRAKVSLMLSTHDKTFGTLKGEEAKKWAEEFEMEMQNYKASLNDVVISTLTNQSLADVSSEKGKEKIKEQIAKEAQDVLGEEHRVLRVNIEEFIIQ